MARVHHPSAVVRVVSGPTSESTHMGDREPEFTDHISSDAADWLDGPGIKVDGPGHVQLSDGFKFDLNDGAEPFQHPQIDDQQERRDAEKSTGKRGPRRSSETGRRSRLPTSEIGPTDTGEA